MSGAVAGAMARLGSLRFPRRSAGVFNASGSAGPRRPVMMILGLLGVVAVIAAIAMGGRHAPVLSQDARLKNVNPLPGGLNSTPEQDKLSLRANDTQAQAALRKGASYTPPMAPSQAVLPSPPHVESAAPQKAAEQHGPIFVGRPPHPPVAATQLQTAFTPLVAEPADPPADPPRPAAIPVAVTTVDPKAEAVYSKQIDDMFSQWGGRAPRTDVVIVPAERSGTLSGADPAQAGASGGSASRDTASPVPVSARAADEAAQVLIPAGRGVYAHPILAVNSDASSPVVLQADSGPIAGDRMIGTFAKQADRLVIHVNSVIHNGENVSADGVVIAPDTMEAAVASNVDQHYISRFILPAAAAFVAGLGQALEQTSNTAAVLSPFGGVSTSTNLDIQQQLGVAAGAAAAQVGNTLNQAAPKGPTVSLEPNVAIGVMFLSNVTAHHAS